MNTRKKKRNARQFLLVLIALLLLVLAAAVVVAVNMDKPEPGANETEGSTQASHTESTGESITTGWIEEGGRKYYVNRDGTYATGVSEINGKTYLLDESGALLMGGWQTFDGSQYYLNGDGTVYTGWLELDGKSYYLRSDGTMARGCEVIDGTNYFFTSTGANILVVNPWNYVPENYEPDLVTLSSTYGEGQKVDSSCYDPLIQMLADCNAAMASAGTGTKAYVVSSYRTHEYQAMLHNRKVQYYLDQGYSAEEAEKEAATISAVPGTSEHQLGLAVDIIDTGLWSLVEEQKNQPAQKWLMAHCQEYGFILRYPAEKIDSTGIIYEPWHYRYVGTEVAKELTESGLSLEEYLEAFN